MGAGMPGAMRKLSRHGKQPMPAPHLVVHARLNGFQQRALAVEAAAADERHAAPAARHGGLGVRMGGHGRPAAPAKKAWRWQHGGGAREAWQHHTRLFIKPPTGCPAHARRRGSAAAQ